MKIQKLFIMVVLVAIIMSFSSIVYGQTDDSFNDVPETYLYKNEIDFCREKGYVLGDGSNNFKPNEKLTRAGMATIWCRSRNIEDANHSFTDITKLKKYYDTPVIILHSLGIINGISKTEYSPKKNVTREELASITMRTYQLGAKDPDAYKRYADNESISEWAREGVSSCINAGVLKGLYDGETFKPSEPVTRGEICKLIYNISKPAHKITIGELTGGTIEADKEIAYAGETVTLTITPNAGKRLKPGTLKYNDVPITSDETGAVFTMPTEDVLITAEFEDIPPDSSELQSIAVKTQPTKTEYKVGDTLDTSGLVVTATYKGDETPKEITGYTTSPANGSILETAGTITITVSYTEGDITRTATFNVQVDEDES